MRHIIIALALCTGCATAQLAPALQSFDCVMADDKLSIAITDTAAARVYLKDLRERAEDGDPEAIGEITEIIARIAKCLPIGEGG